MENIFLLLVLLHFECSENVTYKCLYWEMGKATCYVTLYESMTNITRWKNVSVEFVKMTFPRKEAYFFVLMPSYGKL